MNEKRKKTSQCRIFEDKTFYLSFLGFMTTLDANAPGNYGILDVVKVLEFVQQHIRSFRGDPNQASVSRQKKTQANWVVKRRNINC